MSHSDQAWRANLRITAALLAIYLFCTLPRSRACQLPMLFDPNTHVRMGWCWEFWLNRYQTLLGALLALGAGILAYRAVRRQTEAARASEFQETIISLRDVQVDVAKMEGPMSEFMQEGLDEQIIGRRPTPEEMSSFFDDWQKRFAGAVDINQAVLHRCVRLRCSRQLSRKIAAFSKATFEAINCGMRISQRLSWRVHQRDFEGVIEVINRTRQERVELWTRFSMEKKHLFEALNREIATVEDTLDRIAPAPEP